MTKEDRQQIAKQRRSLGNTLCWTCANIVPKGERGCEWSMYDKPVPGWNAIKTCLRVAQGMKVTSYCVIACPKYKELRSDIDE